MWYRGLFCLRRRVLVWLLFAKNEFTGFFDRFLAFLAIAFFSFQTFFLGLALEVFAIAAIRVRG